jgi:hypothetical protein
VGFVKARLAYQVIPYKWKLVVQFFQKLFGSKNLFGSANHENKLA